MRSYLKSFGLWEYLAEDKQVPALRANPTIAQIKQYEEEKMKRDKVVTCLHSALKDSVFTSIMHLETAKEIWDELKERYEGSERVKNVKMLTLKREFEMLKMKESESVKDYSSKLSELVNQMRLYGETVEDYKVVEKMLINLPKKFEAKVAAIEESCDLKKMTISEMVSKLQAQEQRMSMRSNDVTEGAFQAKLQEKQNFDKGKGKMDASSSEYAGKSKFLPCSTCKRTNHLSKDCWHKGKPQFQCNYCKRWGHKENVCRLKPNQMQPQPAQQANFTDEQPEAEDHLFTMSQACCSASKDVWYVDSGCTSHMVWDSSLFTSLDRNDRTKIKFGNGEIEKWSRLQEKGLSLYTLAKNGKAPMKPNIDGVFYGHSSNESVMDDGAVAKSDSLFLKTRSSADDYEKCNMMVNEPACNEDAAQIDEKKFAMEEELMMKKNQARSSAKAEYIAAAAAPKQAKWIKKVSTDLNYVEKKPTGLWCNNLAFSVAKNPVQHGISKHNNVKFHTIRKAEKNGEVS
ncbi:hypothetical protein EZV62_027530 [Acer yangbiense]|uniref:CCHC-type domain-containing protein n=1 Tax=Acer yangbiense TaxID=1000413 RepID=A0A5C7GVX8_9ROSI|nr:hypothetical protein EZV62_027530 [Acer yangbiense]